MSPTTTATNVLSATDYQTDDQDDQWGQPISYYDEGFQEYCGVKLTELEKLSEGWDCENAPRINRNIIRTVRDFLASLLPHSAPRPMIVPLSAGNLQLEWQSGPVVLELEFESPETVHFLKWHSVKQIEEEGFLETSDRSRLVQLIQWFTKEMMDAR